MADETYTKDFAAGYRAAVQDVLGLREQAEEARDTHPNRRHRKILGHRASEAYRIHSALRYRLKVIQGQAVGARPALDVRLDPLILARYLKKLDVFGRR